MTDAATEWQRSEPDAVVYLPRGTGDEDNEHFLVLEAPDGEGLLAFWTQSSCEGRGDNRLMLARSADGQNWQEPVRIVGARPLSDDLQASWGFPIITRSGRIYVFYTREMPVVDNNRQGSGAMGCIVSDDGGRHWSEPVNIPVARNRFDHPDPEMPRNWIVWQLPIRDRHDKPIAGYTQVTSHSLLEHTYPNWVDQDSRSAFVRFENIDDDPTPDQLVLTWLPEDREGIEVKHPIHTDISVAQEPATVLMPDGGLFCVMRTMTGHIWYSFSEDDGVSWRDPEVLLDAAGEPIPHPMSPCPLYRLEDGRFLLVYHNNPGRKGEYDQFREKWATNQSNFLRNPTFIAVGRFDADAHQPIRFGPAHQLLDTQGVIVGPKATAEIATYPSLTEWQGRRMLWYPDRKYYLLGKHLPDSLLDSIDPT
ncbi:MAG: hypothetical protein HN712_00385 [Gemmatimonadetes bacterium]|mgnify:CR=1 FL=1|nr:hypothetical protein [Gemmatimonadota bacterium]MBT6144777.1 hypothetical protein [Gemmatimonadota bacterium]MBT7858725.1 hypothetical protein [Gemmatimonadota bacterium]